MARFVRLSLVLAGTITSACSGSLLEPPGADIPIVRLRAEPYAYTFNSGLSSPLRVVIRDQDSWRTIWSQIHAPGSPEPALPAFDFSREMIVVAALGTRSSGGYNIVLEAAAEDGPEGVAISVRSSSPGRNCARTAAFTAPVDIASLPVRAGPVRFIERSETTHCD